MAGTSRVTPTNLISVIIPVYNVEEYLPRCLESVAGQTCSNLEIILIDDGSTDSSPETCDTWAEKDGRIKVIHRKNGGAAAARNSGLDAATGEYILFVDADDYLADDAVSLLLKEISSTEDIDCAICGLAFVDDCGIMGNPQAVSEHIVMSGIDAIKERYLYNRNQLNIIGPCGKLFRKDIWSNLRFTDGLYYEDLDIMPYLFTRIQRVACIPNIGYYYYQRAESASHGTGHDDKRVIDSLLIRDKHVSFFHEIGQHEIASTICTMLLDLIITADRNGWIPKSHVKICRQLVKKHWKAAITVSSGKTRLRYMIYRFFGVRVCRLFMR